MKVASLLVFALVCALIGESLALRCVTRRRICSSFGNRLRRCYVSGRIRSVSLIRRISRVPCRRSFSYGYRFRSRYFWVRRGCKGLFKVRYCF